MKRIKPILSILCPSVALLVLILDSKIALQGAQDGLKLCIMTVVPSLFPFFVLSILLTGRLSGRKIPILKPLCRFCKMPVGSEYLLLIGLLGGYPVGAKCVYEAWKQNHLSKDDAQRLLGFCSNAGPAFIFGICSALFAKPWLGWVLWGIHILSAFFVGHILPESKPSIMRTSASPKVTLVDAMSKSITAILNVCGWVILFRVIIAFCQRWFLWLLPENWQTIIEGFLELANGCVNVRTLDSEGLRFILSSAFLGFGGVCVGLQTASVVGELGTGMYFPGKILQCVISVCLASFFAALEYRIFSPVLPGMITTLLLMLVTVKKTVAFPKRLVYNVEKN